MYLLKVYREWKRLFLMVIVFIAGQVFFMFKGIENVPFFLYHMFSTPHATADSVQVLLIQTPQGYFNTNRLSGRDREMLLNTASYFEASQNQNFFDPLTITVRKRFSAITDSAELANMEARLVNKPPAFDRFPAWWLRYFNSIQDQHFDSIRVISTFLHPGRPQQQVVAFEEVFNVANNK